MAKLHQLIGIPLDQDTVHAILKDLDIAASSDNGTALVVNVPATGMT